MPFARFLGVRAQIWGQVPLQAPPWICVCLSVSIVLYTDISNVGKISDGWLAYVTWVVTCCWIVDNVTALTTWANTSLSIQTCQVTSWKQLLDMTSVCPSVCHTDMPSHLVKTVTGHEVFEQTQPRVQYVTLSVCLSVCHTDMPSHLVKTVTGHDVCLSVCLSHRHAKWPRENSYWTWRLSVCLSVCLSHRHAKSPRENSYWTWRLWTDSTKGTACHSVCLSVCLSVCHTDMPSHLVKTVTGHDVFEQTQPRVCLYDTNNAVFINWNLNLSKRTILVNLNLN